MTCRRAGVRAVCTCWVTAAEPVVEPVLHGLLHGVALRGEQHVVVVAAGEPRARRHTALPAYVQLRIAVGEAVESHGGGRSLQLGP